MNSLLNKMVNENKLELEELLRPVRFWKTGFGLNHLEELMVLQKQLEELQTFKTS